jgi:hypothetical protein
MPRNYNPLHLLDHDSRQWINGRARAVVATLEAVTPDTRRRDLCGLLVAVARDIHATGTSRGRRDRVRIGMNTIRDILRTADPDAILTLDGVGALHWSLVNAGAAGFGDAVMTTREAEALITHTAGLTHYVPGM